MNTSVYRQNSASSPNESGWPIPLLAIASILLFSSLLLTGCGQSTSEEDESDEFNTEDVPVNIKKSKQPTVEDILAGPKEAKSEDPSGKEPKENPRLQAWTKVEELINYSERNPEYLSKAARLLIALLGTVEDVSKEECKRMVNEKDFLLGPCNLRAQILAKLSEVYYFKGETIGPEDAYSNRLQMYNKGIKMADEAKEYNQHNIEVQLWCANNNGGWLSMMDGLHPGKFNKWLDLSNEEINELRKTTSAIIRSLQHALFLGRNTKDLSCVSNARDKDDLGMVYLALGHAYHKIPTEMTPFESKDSKLIEAQKCLKMADAIATHKSNETSYLVDGNKLQLPKYYLFELYSDEEGGAFSPPHASNYARKVKRIILDKNFRKRYPVTTRRELDKISEFAQQYGQ